MQTNASSVSTTLDEVGKAIVLTSAAAPPSPELGQHSWAYDPWACLRLPGHMTPLTWTDRRQYGCISVSEIRKCRASRLG